jgi:hypothetical protein
VPISCQARQYLVGQDSWAALGGFFAASSARASRRSTAPPHGRRNPPPAGGPLDAVYSTRLSATDRLFDPDGSTERLLPLIPGALSKMRPLSSFGGTADLDKMSRFTHSRGRTGIDWTDYLAAGVRRSHWRLTALIKSTGRPARRGNPGAHTDAVRRHGRMRCVRCEPPARLEAGLQGRACVSTEGCVGGVRSKKHDQKQNPKTIKISNM